MTPKMAWHLHRVTGLHWDRDRFSFHLEDIRGCGEYLHDHKSRLIVRLTVSHGDGKIVFVDEYRHDLYEGMWRKFLESL